MEILILFILIFIGIGFSFFLFTAIEKYKENDIVEACIRMGIAIGTLLNFFYQLF